MVKSEFLNQFITEPQLINEQHMIDNDKLYEQEMIDNDTVYMHVLLAYTQNTQNQEAN